jgi:hypothetical protein
MGNGDLASSRSPLPGEIWLVINPRLPGAEDPHYAVITAVTRDLIYLHFITTDGDVARDDDFRLAQDMEDFKDTGLSHSCHIRQQFFYGVALKSLNAKYRGRLTGEVKKKVEDWFGEKLG